MNRLSTIRSQLVHSILEQNQVDSKKNFGKPVYIVAGKRTPIGSFLGKLSKYTGPQLGGMAIKEALSSINLSPKEVDDVIMGNVCQAGIGQNPARQASLLGGVGVEVPCTTVNKVCCSSIKAVAYGAMAVGQGLNDTVITGGFESMSNAPFTIEKHRKGHTYGDQVLVDELQLSLKDAYTKKMMGLCADGTAKKYNITRQNQDDYTVLSYARAAEATKTGKFKDEITPIKLTEKDTLTEDEEYKRFNKEKMLNLKPAFSKEGTVTPANASKIDDAGVALVLMSEEKMKSKNLKPLAKIIGHADAETEPTDFCIAPSIAIQKLLERTGLKVQDIDFFEINEAFAVAALANMKILGLDVKKVNVNGGAISMGHPIGMSGARLILSLISVLKQNKGKYGIASLCNGGGGATAVLIENLQ